MFSAFLNFIFGLSAGLLFCVWLIDLNYIETKTVKATAIENNCGQYNPKTGEFEWLKVSVDAVDMSKLVINGAKK